jgi:NADP-dependent 3-hydroxy acid dehydrogenase YdfG
VLGVARQFVMSPNDIAQAVLYAVTAPETVHIGEIMIRPPQALQIPGMSVPA